MRWAALIACLAVAGALLAHWGTAPEPDYWDASTEPVGAAPKFVELWSGEPVYDPVGALPSPADATLIVEEPFMTALSRKPLRASTFKLPLADGRFADLSRGRAAKPLRELLRSFDGAIGPGGLLATDASGRFVVHEYGGGLSVYDLVAAEELTLDVARSASAPEWAPSLRGLPPPRSVFRSRGGREVVVVRSGESREPRFELFVGDERPRGKRYRAVVAFVPASDYRNEPRLDVELFDAATGAVLARRMNTFLRDSDGERAEWAVHADTARLAIARNGVARAESLLGEAETVEEFGGGNVTALAAMSAGFVTGHADGTVRLWREKTPTTLAVLPGPVGRVRTFGERVEASVRARSDDERVVSACVVIAGRVETFAVRLESPRGEPLDVGNDRWLVRRTPGGSRASPI